MGVQMRAAHFSIRDWRAELRDLRQAGQGFNDPESSLSALPSVHGFPFSSLSPPFGIPFRFVSTWSGPIMDFLFPTTVPSGMLVPMLSVLFPFPVIPPLSFLRAFKLLFVLPFVTIYFPIPFLSLFPPDFLKWPQRRPSHRLE